MHVATSTAASLAAKVFGGLSDAGCVVGLSAGSCPVLACAACVAAFAALPLPACGASCTAVTTDSEDLPTAERSVSVTAQALPPLQIRAATSLPSNPHLRPQNLMDHCGCTGQKHQSFITPAAPLFVRLDSCPRPWWQLQSLASAGSRIWRLGAALCKGRWSCDGLSISVPYVVEKCYISAHSRANEVERYEMEDVQCRERHKARHLNLLQRCASG